jgi:hypothetical protein
MTKTNVLWRNRPSTPSNNKRRYDLFLAEHPGLREALMQSHRISMDLDAKLMSFGSLSSAQIALAFKLHSDAYCPARPSEINVPAPEGRQVIRGTVVSVKEHRGDFGDTLKMTVKVVTAAGTFLCWGTVPSSLTARTWSPCQTDHAGALTSDLTKGSEVEFTATLTRGREPHFAFFKRPTNARIVDAEPALVELEPRPGVVCAQMNAGLR